MSVHTCWVSAQQLREEPQPEPEPEPVPLLADFATCMVCCASAFVRVCCTCKSGFSQSYQTNTEKQQQLALLTLQTL